MPFCLDGIEDICGDKGLAAGAQPVNFKFHDVPSREVGLTGQAQRDSRGCSGVDQISGAQDHELAQVPHNVGDVEDLVGGGTVLPHGAVDPLAAAFQLELPL